MNINRPENISDFYVAGISYKKTDAAVRGEFAISNIQYENILKQALSFNVHSLFVLSTCNRTEVYGFADNSSTLIDLLCTQTNGSASDFTQLAYIKNGNEAVEHLFNVGAGLDSQILGDYEIVGQLKKAVQFARDRNYINCFIDRLVSSVLKSSKSVKNETCLSEGTVSVSFAAVQYIKEKVSEIANKNILLIGTGKIGRNTCKNLVDYLETTNITLINRTEQKAEELANELGLKHAQIDDISAQISAADIILTATGAPEPTILLKHVEHSGEKLIIDLSIPYSTEAGISQLHNVQLINVDMLSELKDNALKKREAEVPFVRNIIEQHIIEFMEWYNMRKNAPTLHAIKLMLSDIALLHQRELQNPHTNCPYITAEQKIRQVMNTIADKMRNDNQQSCYYIEAVNDYIKRSAI